ncbi:MAG: hypothetical protein PHD22_14685 [Zoogloea sp.]|nr:hypothetical protein [Zoogloea sp.]MDD3354863.1 hypothetical protein [Zoogloea sp.]
MALAEGRQQRRDEARTKRQGQVHAQQPACLDPLRGGAGFRFIDLRQDAQARLQIIVAGLGQAQPACAAMQELDPEACLQCIEMLGGHRRGHAQVPPSRAQAAGADGTHKDAHASDAIEHLISPFR